MEFDLTRMENESQDQYFYRICKMKDSLGFTWPQMTEIFNNEFGCNKGDTAYRKKWAAFNDVFSANIDKIVGDKTYLNEIKTATDEFYKAKKQFYDQRREYNKQLTIDARADHLYEKLIEAAQKVPLKDYSSVLTFRNASTKREEALLCISDWHFGMTSNNIWNEYNVNICIERVSKLFEKVTDILKGHNVSVLNIAILGDMINGAIHTTSRVASEENACEQLMDVSELLANFINGVSICVDKVNVYSTYGNHARTIQSKEDSVHSDNMERIIPWWLKQRLNKNNKVSIVDNEYYEFIYMQIFDRNIVCTHGDLDRFKDFGMTVNALFNKKYGKSFDYTFSADKHHTESFEQFGIESTLVGSLCGTDEYANNKRLYSNPMQTMCIFTPEDGKLCSYNIKL